MAIPVLVRSVGPEPFGTTNYYTNWTQFVAGYPKYKNQPTSFASIADASGTVIGYRAVHDYFTGDGDSFGGSAPEIVTRVLNIDPPYPDVGEYHDIPVTGYSTGGTGFNPDPGNSQNADQPSGAAILDVVVTESFAMRSGDTRVTPWHTPNFVQEREVNGARWANLNAVQTQSLDTAASVPLAAALTTELLAQDFGFSLPVGAQITGIEVEAARKVIGGAAEKRQTLVSADFGPFGVSSIVRSEDWFNFRPVLNTGGPFEYIVRANGVWIATVSALPLEIWRSVDDGLMWTQISHPGAMVSSGGIGESNGVWIITPFVGTDTPDIDTALRSTDNGLTWSTVTLGFGISNNHAKSAPVSDGAGTWLVGGRFNTNSRVSRSTDNGVTWALIPTIFGKDVSHIFWTGVKFVLVTFGDIVANSVNGLTWTTRDYGVTVMGNSSAYPVMLQGQVVYADTNNGNIFYSSDHGDTWSVAASPALPEYTNVPGSSVHYDELNDVYRWLGVFADWWSVALESDDFPPTSFRVSEYLSADNDWHFFEVALGSAVADKYGLSFEAVHLLAPTPVSGQIFDEGRELIPGATDGGWDLLGTTYSGVSEVVGGVDTWISGVAFTADGNTMFAPMYDPGSNGLRAERYSLGTPWDVTTAVVNQNVVLSTSHSPLPGGCQLSDDGSRFYCQAIGVSGPDNGLIKLLQFNLGTPYDLTSASLAATYPDGSLSGSMALTIGDSGTRLYRIGDGTACRMYTLSTPWDLASRVLVESGVNLGFPNGPIDPTGVAVKGDGTRLIVSSFNYDRLDKIELASPWFLTSAAAIDTSHSVASELASGDKIYGLFMREDGEQLYTATTNNDTGGNSRVSKYTFGTPAVTFEYDESELFEGRTAAPMTSFDVGRFGGDGLRGADADIQEGTRTWTAAEINDPAFGVGYFARGQQGTLELGAVRARIYYRADFSQDTLPAKRPKGLAGVAESPGGVKVAVGVDGKILRRAANGSTWDTIASGTTVSLNAVEWVGDRFVAVGVGGIALEGTADGSTWTRIETGASTSLWAIRRVPGTLRAVAVGNDDYSFQRDRLGEWTL